MAQATKQPIPLTKQTSETPRATPEQMREAAPVIIPQDTWPPPLYIKQNASHQEIYYMEHRWYAQWNYYDSKASQAKRKYQFWQLIIAVGSVAVPVLVSFRPDGVAGDVIGYATIFISLVVAIAAAIENVKKYGDDWRTYRTSAEELKREKSLYDVTSGPYRRSKNPFLLFVERSEDIMAKQNGSWAALKEEQVKQQDHAEGTEAGTVSATPEAG